MCRIGQIILMTTCASYGSAAVCLALGGQWKSAAIAGLFAVANAVIFFG